MPAKASPDLTGEILKLTVGTLDEAHVQLSGDQVQHLARARMVVDGAMHALQKHEGQFGSPVRIDVALPVISTPHEYACSSTMSGTRLLPYAYAEPNK
jgi:hypothetical protein